MEIHHASKSHDKLGHQGNSHTYCLIKHQYYWKGMNKDIRKYIANCILCRWDKAKVQQYPLQMTEIPDKPFDKIAIDLVPDCETSTSGNKHILTYLNLNKYTPGAVFDEFFEGKMWTILSENTNKYVHAKLRQAKDKGDKDPIELLSEGADQNPCA